jgi:hypothetical protein
LIERFTDAVGNVRRLGGGSRAGHHDANCEQHNKQLNRLHIFSFDRIEIEPEKMTDISSGDSLQVRSSALPVLCKIAHFFGTRSVASRRVQ